MGDMQVTFYQGSSASGDGFAVMRSMTSGAIVDSFPITPSTFNGAVWVNGNKYQHLILLRPKSAVSAVIVVTDHPYGTGPDHGSSSRKLTILLSIAYYSYNGNSSACRQKAMTSVGRFRIRRRALRA